MLQQGRSSKHCAKAKKQKLFLAYIVCFRNVQKREVYYRDKKIYQCWYGPGGRNRDSLANKQNKSLRGDENVLKLIA